MSAEEALEAELDDDPEEERPPVCPFYHVAGDALEGATIRAGYVTETGEVDYLVMDMTDVGVNRVEQAFTLAFGWYCDQLNAMAERAAAEQADEAEASADG